MLPFIILKIFGKDGKMGDTLQKSSFDRVPVSAETFFVNVVMSEDGHFSGTICQSLQEYEITFSGIDDAIFKIDRILDKSGYTQSPSELRSFSENKKETDKNIDIDYRDTIILKNEENQQINCFIIDIKYRQNSSWQGCLTWRNHSEEPKKQNFRSVLELMKLIHSSFEGCNSAQL